ncbi:RHS repeat-associated core domain-containing protein [Porphyromonas macacae]
MSSLEDITTWVFEEGSFVPCAKLQNGESYSIITDYPGTPTEMYNSDGKKTWSAELDIYGCVRTFRGRSLSDCPFRYQGQYEDEETGLYYNRFRYYDCNTGCYISQDPIGLAGNNPTLYGYVKDINSWIDVFGLSELVYQLLNAKGEVVYYGITSRTAEERWAEHLANPNKKGKISKMQILAEDLTHDEARSIEGALIRKRMDERLTLMDRMNNLSIEEQLKKSGLLNKNRGRVKDRWTSDNPLEDLKEKMHKTPKTVNHH